MQQLQLHMMLQPKLRHAPNLVSSFSVMSGQGQSSHVITTIFLLPSRTLLLSNPLRAHHSASFKFALRAAELDASTSQSAAAGVKASHVTEEHVSQRMQQGVPQRQGEASPGNTALAAL